MIRREDDDGSTLPQYKINWVRVYQNKNDPKQKIGCSTPERPTRRYIEANADLYKRAVDKTPLKEIERGGGKCSPTADPLASTLQEICGGSERGGCHPQRKLCYCHTGWTGPYCLSSDGFNDIEYDIPDGIADLNVQFPTIVPFFLIGGICFLLILMSAGVLFRSKLDDYNPIPDQPRPTP